MGKGAGNGEGRRGEKGEREGGKRKGRKGRKEGMGRLAIPILVCFWCRCA